MFDMSLFFGEPTEQTTQKVLEKDVVYPVCTPEIAQRLNSPTDLLNETWLYDALWADDWPLWLNQAAFSQINHQNGPQFSLYSIAIEEAKNGAGVLIGHEILIKPLLKSGELIAPFRQKALTGKSLILEFAGNTSASCNLARVASMLTKNHS
jgi:LysR family glycine cleavage system transcriptional activator